MSFARRGARGRVLSCGGTTRLLGDRSRINPVMTLPFVFGVSALLCHASGPQVTFLDLGLKTLSHFLLLYKMTVWTLNILKTQKLFKIMQI